MSEAPTLHCWAGESEWIAETYGYLSDEYIAHAAARDEPGWMGRTCMLLDGHAGPHKWTRDDKITIRFNKEDP